MNTYVSYFLGTPFPQNEHPNALHAPLLAHRRKERAQIRFKKLLVSSISASPQIASSQKENIERVSSSSLRQLIDKVPPVRLCGCLRHFRIK